MGLLCVSALLSARVEAAVAAPEGATVLSADTIATAARPVGFRYAVIREGVIDDVGETLLYVKARKEAKTSRAVPIPKDRALLASCIAGGTVDDLVKGARVSVRYDGKGVVRPEIVILSQVTLEVIDGARVIDRGGSKLYVSTPEGGTRGFQIEGGAAAWEGVVQGGPTSALVAGARVRIEHDPSGRQPLKITLLDPPKTEAGSDKGCGCAVVAPGAGAGRWPAAAALALWLLGMLVWRGRLPHRRR